MPITSIVGLSGSVDGQDDSTSSQPTSRTNSQSTRAASSTPSPTIVSDRPAPSPLSSSSPSVTSSVMTETTAASSQVTAVAAAAQPQGTPAGSIAGLVIGLLLLVGLVLFGVRWFFIRKREHKATPARSRISRLNISGPTGFTHLQSGAASGVGMTGRTPGASAGATAADGSAAQMATPTHSTRGPTAAAATTEANAVAASPYDRIKQKYSFDLNQLETGLSDHMETMKSSRKNAPSQ